MYLAMIVAVLVGSSSLSEDYEQLKTLSHRNARAHKALKMIPRAQQDAVLRHGKDFARRLDVMGDAFVAKHCEGVLSQAAVDVLVESSRLPFMPDLVEKYCDRALQGESMEEFVSNCGRLARAGLAPSARESLAVPYAIGLFATGKVDEARLFAEKSLPNMGVRTGQMVDVLAAIYASQGEMDKARKLFSTQVELEGVTGSIRNSRSSMLGRAAPPLQAKTWLETEEEGVEFGERTVVLDFWQTWCPPCRELLPELSRLRDDEKAEVVGVCANDGRGGFDLAENKRIPRRELEEGDYVAHVAKFLDDADVSCPVGVTEDTSLHDAFNVVGFPTLVVVDKEGRVAWMKTGSTPGTSQLVRALVSRLSAKAD